MVFFCFASQSYLSGCVTSHYQGTSPNQTTFCLLLVAPLRNQEDLTPVKIICRNKDNHLYHSGRVRINHNGAKNNKKRMQIIFNRLECQLFLLVVLRIPSLASGHGLKTNAFAVDTCLDIISIQVLLVNQRVRVVGVGSELPSSSRNLDRRVTNQQLVPARIKNIPWEQWTATKNNCKGTYPMVA